MKRTLFFLIILTITLLATPATASWYEFDLESHDISSYVVDDVTDYEFNAEDDQFVSWIAITEVDPSETTSINISTSSTYQVNISLDYSYPYCDTTVEMIDYINTTNETYNATWYRFIPTDDAQFYIGSSAGATVGEIKGGFTNIAVLFDHEVTADQSFTITSDGPVKLEYTVVSFEFSEGNPSYWNIMLDMVDNVPYIGDYIVLTFQAIAFVLGAFFIIINLLYYNWAALLIMFETIVVGHATALIMFNNDLPAAMRMIEGFKAIGHDNKVMIELFVAFIMGMIRLVMSTISAVGNWIPFT